MLSEENRQQYQELSEKLAQFQHLAAQEHLDKVALLSRHQELQQFFGGLIVALDKAPLSHPGESLVQSYTTEIHKQLRLMGMDITFLQASRSVGTTQMRKKAISDRLQTIMGYCSTLLAETESTTAENSHQDEKP
mgnify:CR=1 FL=1|jgi:hypothetical protein